VSAPRLQPGTFQIRNGSASYPTVPSWSLWDENYVACRTVLWR